MNPNASEPQMNRRGSTISSLPNHVALSMALSMSLTDAEAAQLTSVVTQTIHLKRAQHLFRAGDSFRSVYLIRAGSFMSSILSEDGRQQVTGFPIAGELLGLDGVSVDSYPSSALALEDALLYELPFDALLYAVNEMPGLQRKFFQLMSREIVKDQGMMMLLGTLSAEEKLATFLVNLSQNYQARGFSSTQFQLRMRREDIGSYLGVQLETISRTLSKFQTHNLIRVQMRELQIIDLKGLRDIMDGLGTKRLH